MAGKEDARIFVGGLAWETTDRQLADTFSRFGKVLDAQVRLGLGFLLFRFLTFFSEFLFFVSFCLTS